MIIRTVTFTDEGKELSKRIAQTCNEHIVEAIDADSIEESFKYRIPLVFIGACGIAVRKIAPYVKDKLTDSAVIVVDEKGEYIIPILSGHLGGANALAEYIADRIGGQAVITTATDVEDVFSVDVYAKEAGLRIYNREGIRKIAKKVLNGKILKWNTDINDKNDADILLMTQKVFDDLSDYARPEDIILIKKPYVLGIGCRKNTNISVIENAVTDVLDTMGIEREQFSNYFYKVASIDLKEKEYGLNLFAQKNGVIFECYTAYELNELEGDFAASTFVCNITGTDNVCERAAIMAAGDGGEIVVGKTCNNGVTVAVAKRSEELYSFIK